MRMKREADSLRRASDHLYYELSMLRHTAAVLATGALSDSHLSNACIESFTVHFRAIVDFLYSEKPFDSDVIAEDFFSSPDEWTSRRPELAAQLSSARKRVNKEIAHLTYDRQHVVPELKDWNFKTLYDEISSAVKRFVELVSPTYLGSRWSALKTPSDMVPTLVMVSETNCSTNLK